jgi:glycosyltransferase involved in cell wall biosynthesis
LSISKRVLYVITSLDAGGAERCLQQTIAHLDKDQFNSLIVCLKSNGVIGREIQVKGVRVLTCNFSLKGFRFLSFIRVIGQVMQFKPKILHGWMYHGILFSGLLKLIMPSCVWMWSIHNKDVSVRGLRWSTRGLAKGLSFFSPWAKKIIYNSTGAQLSHEGLGYAKSKSWVLRNGYDPMAGKILNSADKMARRERLAWPKASAVVGYVSRFHPQKDVDTFLRAAQLMVQQDSQLCFVCCGHGFSPSHQGWWDKVCAHGLENHLVCQEWLSPIEEALEAFDILVLSSIEESLPNVLGEAMVCGVPWVSTDVGDVRELCIPPCQIVPREDPEALARASLALLKAPAQGSTQLRQHIVEKFSLLQQQQLLQKAYTDGCV